MREACRGAIYVIRLTREESSAGRQKRLIGG